METKDDASWETDMSWDSLELRSRRKPGKRLKRAEPADGEGGVKSGVKNGGSLPRKAGVAARHCRVCGEDVSDESEYYRRASICRRHSHGSFLMNGRCQQWCQLCAQLHDPACFDEDRRSCRQALEVHNQRRRARRVRDKGGVVLPAPPPRPPPRLTAWRTTRRSRAATVREMVAGPASRSRCQALRRMARRGRMSLRRRAQPRSCRAA